MKIKIPLETKSELNQNEHWRYTHKRRKAQKLAVGLVLNTHKRPALPCVVKFTRISPRALDKGDNLNSSMKAARDQVAKWLGVDDGGDDVIWEYDQEKGRPGEKAVLIEIKEKGTT